MMGLGVCAVRTMSVERNPGIKIKMACDQCENSTSSNTKNDSKNPRKQRGNYLSWLRDPKLQAEPRVSEWRARKRQKIASTQLEDTESETTYTDHVAEMSRLEVEEIVGPEGKKGSENIEESIIEGEEFTDDFSCASHEEDTNADYGSCDGHRDADSGVFVYKYEHYADDEDDLSFCSDTEGNEEEESCKSNSQSSKEYDQPLIYSGARLTLMASMLLVLTFSMKHSLTSDALSDLLILVELHCLSPNVFRTTMRLFNAFFKDLRSVIEFHYYCTSRKCNTYLGTNTPELCPTCHARLVAKKNCSYFVVVPIIQQLHALLNNGNLLQDILNYKASHKRGANITDVLDGNLYKTHFGHDGFFIGTKKKEKKELHISFQMNTDGVSLFRSSSFSVWPVYLIINEIPPKIRFTRKHRLFIGLWFGKEKPFFKTFMRPFAESLKELFHKGADILVAGSTWKIRAILLCGVFDAPARCLFQEMMQFNGHYGCPFCQSPGESVKTSERGSTHTYPYNLSSRTGHGTERTHADTVSNAKKADRERNPVEGVKGSTWFMFVPKFDIIRGISIDYMHCVLLGVMKMLMHLWFDKSSKGESYNISSKVKEVDQRLAMLHPPNFITRLPRTIEDLKHYKASEFKSFLLYFGIPCLLGLLPNEYYQHFILLVEAIYILLQDSISGTDLQKASLLLKHFCLNMSALYGKRYETSNCHTLLHLVQKVKDLGPLWSQSCFYFEDYSGELRRLFHGTQNIDQQITLAVSINQNLPLLESCLVPGTTAHFLYEKLSLKGKQPSQKMFCLAENIYCIGAMTSYSITGEDKSVVEKAVGTLKETSILKFKRILLNGEIVHSEDYKPVIKRNSYTVSALVGDCTQYFSVQYYVKTFVKCGNPVFCRNSSPCSICSTPHYLAVAKKLEKGDLELSQDKFTNAKVHHIIPVKCTRNLFAFPISSIVSLCVFVSFNYELDFVCLAPNRVERE